MISPANEWAIDTIAKADMRFAERYNPDLPELARICAIRENGKIVDLYNPPAPKETYGP